jgi:hypothetical protein
VASVLEFLPHLSPALAALLFPLWLVYRLIRPSQDTSLRERTGRKRKESAIVSCAAYVGLFLAASLFFVLVILLVYLVTVPERHAPEAVPQESHWSVTQVSLDEETIRLGAGIRWVYHPRCRLDHLAGWAAVAGPGSSV